MQLLEYKADGWIVWVVSSNEDEELVAASKLEESQSARSDENLHPTQRSYSNELDPSSAMNAMLSTLLPEYYSSHQTGLYTTREKTLPSTSSTFRSRSMDVDELPESSDSQAGFNSTREKTLPSISSILGSRSMDVDHPEKSDIQAGFISTREGTLPLMSNSLLIEPSSTIGSRVDQFERSNSQASLDSARVGATSKVFGTDMSGRGVSNPSSKPRRSYKDLVNQMLNNN